MRYVVVIADDVDPAGLELLQESGQLEVVSTVGNEELLAESMSRAHALLVRSSTRVTGQLLANAPSLKVVGRAGIGVDNIDVKVATQRGIAVLNAPGANTVSAGEHAIALLLALLRYIPEASQSMREGRWDRNGFLGTEIRGKVLGIVGLGRVGSHVAGMARSFGMHVIAHDPFLSAARADELHVTLYQLDDLLTRSDVVSLHLPLTDDTKDMINREKLAVMKKEAVLVNTARGELVDEDALVEAVKTGEIAGAALDVFSEEPLPADSPLRQCDRIIVTPHLGASTTEAQTRVSLEICRSVRNALLTGDMRGAVNIPGVSGEALGRLRPLLELSRRVGCLAAAIARGRVGSVNVHYGGNDDEAPKPTMLASVEGVLSSMGVGPVSLINSMALAVDRGISVERRVGPPATGLETTVGVDVTTDEKSVRVVGALFGDQVGRIVAIDEFAVDFMPQGNVLVLKNTDVPGVIGKVGTVLGAAGINIGSYNQSRSDGGGEALAAIVVDMSPAEQVIKQLERLPDVLDVRFVDLN